jgi:mannose-6-phosphate isomerase-like protein (cupin superfamily)
MIEQYFYDDKGYNPYLIQDNWQVAQLNYVEKHGLDDMDSIEVHKETDEVFILLKGRAVLIAANVEKDKSLFYEAVNMQQGVSYNIPKGVWHNIAMDKDTQIIIVEKSNTHINDCTLWYLTDSERKKLYQSVKDVL